MAKNVALPAINIPLIDKTTGLMSDEWYQFFESQIADTVSDSQDKIDENTSQISDKLNKDTEVTAGNGLSGGGPLEGGITIDALQDTGWTVGTGTASRGAYATYTGQTISAVYTPSEAQTTDDAVRDVSRRLRGIETALRNNGSIDG